MRDKQKLTKNSKLVLEALKVSKEPMSAYAIIDKLRDSGISSPPTVYRALRQLMDLNLVHRLESINSFLVCDHPPHHENHDEVAFAICDECGQVEELSDQILSSAMSNLAENAAFKVKTSTVEIHGSCSNCNETSEGKQQ